MCRPEKTKLTWLDDVQPMIYKSNNHNILEDIVKTVTRFLRCLRFFMA